jgi:hypothetical protein
MTVMDRREERLRGKARLSRQGEDDGSFDREFWSGVPAAQRLELVWDMVLEFLASQGDDNSEPRLQKSVCHLERRQA